MEALHAAPAVPRNFHSFNGASTPKKVTPGVSFLHRQLHRFDLILFDPTHSPTHAHIALHFTPEDAFIVLAKGIESSDAKARIEKRIPEGYCVCVYVFVYMFVCMRVSAVDHLQNRKPHSSTAHRNGIHDSRTGINSIIIACGAVCLTSCKENYRERECLDGKFSSPPIIFHPIEPH